MKKFIFVYSYTINEVKEIETGFVDTEKDLLNCINAIANRKDIHNFKIVCAAEIAREIILMARPIIIEVNKLEL